MERRTLHYLHVDQHFVNASTKYCKKWSVNANNRVGRKHVRFYRKDDKSKTPVGTDVAVNTGARRTQKAIVPPDSSLSTKFAADHDWSNASIIPSVTFIEMHLMITLCLSLVEERMEMERLL